MAGAKREKKSKAVKRLPKQARPGASDGVFIPATRSAVIATEQPGPVNASQIGIPGDGQQRRNIWQRLRRVLRRR